mgnify:FL=1
MKDLILWFGIILVFIFDFLAYYFYYKSLRYWHKKDFFDYLGGGILTLLSHPKKIKSLPQPGRKYAGLAVKFYSLMLITFGITLITYFLLSLIDKYL